MAWPQLDNVEALVRSARHNARFGGVRLPLIFIVSGFLWQLIAPVAAITWIVAMVIVERVSTYVRGRLVAGETELAAAHLLTLCMMSALWVCFGILLWTSNTEIGRIAAIIGLLTTSLYGALGGQKDIRPAFILTAPPLLSLGVLVSLYAWTHWSPWDATISSLATFGAGISVLVCAWALNRSDVTLQTANRELEQVAAKLATNTTLLEEMSSLAHVGGWRLDLVNQRLEWTAQTRDIHDVEDGFEPTLESALNFYLPESREVIQRAIELAMKTGEGWDLELQIKSARGVVKWVRANGKVAQTDGVVTSLVGAFADISTRVQMEAELRQSQKLESIGRLTGGIAHDFNNMLTAILSSAEVLENAQEPRTAQIAGVIAKAAERAGDLTGKLLAFSRQQVLSPVALDLNVAVREAAELLAPTLSSTVDLRCELNSEPLFAALDPAQLTNAILNLVVNASDAMPEGGVLRIATFLKGTDGVALEVSDSGAGMAPAIVDKIFEPFFTTKAEGIGTGLGLSMVHGFVTQSGGSVRVVSAPNKGATFTLIFPRSTAEGDALVAASPPRKVMAARANQVLLVDDDDLVRESLARALEQNGYVVTSASAGEAALTLQKRNQYDFAIVDVVLTKQMSGPELVRRMRQHDPELRAIFVSGYKNDADVYTVDGAVDFIAKPFSVNVLIERLQAMQSEQPLQKAVAAG